MSSTKFVFFGPIVKTRWPPWPLIGWDIFNFSFETAELNSTNLDRKQDLNVFYQVCVFGPIGKTRWPPWLLIGWDIFNFSSETAKRNWTKLDRKQNLKVLFQVYVYCADRKNKMAALVSDRLDIFNLSDTAEQNSTKLDMRQGLNVLYQDCNFFFADQYTKMAALADSSKECILYTGARYVALWASCMFKCLLCLLRQGANYVILFYILRCFVYNMACDTVINNLNLIKNPASSWQVCSDWLSAIPWKDTHVCVTRWKFQLNLQPL